MFMDVVNPCGSIADPFVSGFIGWPDLGNDGLDLCFSLLLACPILSAAGERRRFIVMRGGSVLNMSKNFKSESKKLLQLLQS